MTIKYYLYISDTKVDMLSAQIPKNILNKISADLNINLGVFNVTLKENQSEQTRFDKVNVVSNYINKHLDVGDIDHPQTYFKARVPTRWGSLFGGSNQNFVYFAGKTDQTIFGLGGSMQHVIGEQKGQPPGANSFTPSILAALKKLDIHSDFGVSSDIPSHGDPLQLVASAAGSSELGPEETLEFLAKKLVEGSLDSKHILLGSPIYVAYAD
jgi:Family of unknown function (DUF7019)